MARLIYLGQMVPLEDIDEADPESELLYGWRGMSLKERKNRPMLKGVVTTWPEREMIATCDPKARGLEAQKQEHDPERTARLHLGNDACRCGIYALKKIDLDMLDHPLLALCVLDGVLVEGTTGYRAERVRLEQLWWNPAAQTRGHIRSDSVDFLWALKDYDIPWQIGLPPIDNIDPIAHPKYEEMKGQLKDYGHWRDYQKKKDREADEVAAERAFSAAFASTSTYYPGSGPAPNSGAGSSTDSLTHLLSRISQQGGCIGRRCRLTPQRDVERCRSILVHTDGRASPGKEHLTLTIDDSEVRRSATSVIARCVTELLKHHARTDGGNSPAPEPSGYTVQQLQKEQRSMWDRLRRKR